MPETKIREQKSLINFSELSRRLTGHRGNLKPEIIPKRFQEAVDDLSNVIEEWKVRHKDILK
jgi:hypothetical protein